MTLWVLAALAAAGAARAQDAPVVMPQFVEETAASGIASTYAGEWQYMVGGGAAAFDCNSDDFADLFLAGGAAPATFYRNASTAGGALRFVAEPSGLEAEAVTGAYPLDVDSDGIMDLVLLRVGESLAMRGLGNCRFERANEAWGFDGGDAWATAFAATWERGATWPTIAVGTYIDRREEAFPWGSCTDNWLQRGAEGRFGAPLPLSPSYCALSMLFTDWNRSGTPSLRISNDREYYKGGQEQLWRVDPGQPPARYTEADGWKPLKIWGMGIASTDLTGDGYPDYFLTSMADNKLQTLAAPPAEGPVLPGYADVALKRGVTAQRPYTPGAVQPSTAWHAEFGDVNNDTRADLFIAKGNVDQMPDFALEDPNNLLMQQPDGTFIEAGGTAGVGSTMTSRGGALVDLNRDGLLDLVVVNRWTTAQVWRNVTEGTGHWVQVRLRQPGPNPDAVGAMVEVRCGDAVALREVTVGGGHAGGQAGWLHFGLGAATAAEVRVTWPGGTPGAWMPLASDGFAVIDRVAGVLPAL